MSRVTKRLRPCRAGHVGMDALWVKRLTQGQQRLRLMLLVWAVLCKSKAMTGAGGDAPCHIPQGPPKYRPSDKRPEEGEGPAVTEVASHAGCRLRGAQTWVAVVPRCLPPHPSHPDFRHASSGAWSFSKLTARSICTEGHTSYWTRPGSRQGWRTPVARPSLVSARLAANPMKRVRNGLV